MLINLYNNFDDNHLVAENNANHKENKTDDDHLVVSRRTKVSSISLNIPAAGLGSRPSSIVTTSDEGFGTYFHFTKQCFRTLSVIAGGFNEPSPKIEARLKPHEESLYDFPINEDIPVEYHEDNSPTEDVNEYSEGEVVLENPIKLTQAEIEALYAVPNKNKNQAAANVPIVDDRRQYSVGILVTNERKKSCF